MTDYAELDIFNFLNLERTGRKYMGIYHCEDTENKYISDEEYVAILKQIKLDVDRKLAEMYPPYEEKLSDSKILAKNKEWRHCKKCGTNLDKMIVDIEGKHWCLNNHYQGSYTFTGNDKHD